MVASAAARTAHVGGVEHACAARQGVGQGAAERVAGGGRVDGLDRHRRNVRGLAVLDHQRALGAERDDHGARALQREREGRRVADRHRLRRAEQGAELAAVGHEHVDAGQDGVRAPAARAPG